MGKLIAYRRPAEGADEMSDEALLAGSATGDAASLTALYRRHHRTLYRFLARLAGVDERDLDDLVQGTFLAIHGAAASYRGTSSVRTWMIGIAINVAGKHVRGEVRRKAFTLRAQELAPPSAEDVAAQAEHRQTLDRLAAALRRLPHDLRVVFVLVVLEDMPGREAAQLLGIREGTLWRRLHEARTELRRAVEET